MVKKLSGWNFDQFQSKLLQGQVYHGTVVYFTNRVSLTFLRSHADYQIFFAEESRFSKNWFYKSRRLFLFPL